MSQSFRPYPFCFEPFLKETLWGGQRLKYYKNSFLSSTDEEKSIGESWEIVDMEHCNSRLVNGALRGKTLRELIKDYAADFLGPSAYPRFLQFPLLIKFIDAKSLLSLQVHPNDEQAKTMGYPFGKSEIWYIVEAEKDAYIINGLREDVPVDSSFLKKAIAQERLHALTRKIPVEAGQFYYIPAGRIHAIGGGILLAEIQQSSDVTYRLYDWNRKDAQGQPRKLHVDEGLSVTQIKSRGEDIPHRPILNGVIPIIQTPFFTVRLLHLRGTLLRDFSSRSSFTVYMNVGNEPCILKSHGNEDVVLSPLSTALIPHNLKILTLNNAGEQQAGSPLLEVGIDS